MAQQGTTLPLMPDMLRSHQSRTGQEHVYPPVVPQQLPIPTCDLTPFGALVRPGYRSLPDAGSVCGDTHHSRHAQSVRLRSEQPGDVHGPQWGR